jgi:hypothetical protein
MVGAAMKTDDLAARWCFIDIGSASTVATQQGRKLFVGVDADRVYLGATMPANANDIFVGSQAENMGLACYSPTYWKCMAKTIAGFVYYLHCVHLLVRVDMHFHNLAVFGKDVVGEFLAPCTAGRSTFSRDHGVLVPEQLDSCIQEP